MWRAYRVLVAVCSRGGVGASGRVTRVRAMLLLAWLSPQAWTTLVTPGNPQRLDALLKGTAAAPTSAASALGGLSYVWNASDLTRLTYAVDDRVCSNGSPQFVSFVDRLPGAPPSCAQVRLWVGRALSVWWEGSTEVGGFVDVTDDCRAAYGGATTATCSAEAGGPAKIFVTLEAEHGGHAAQQEPPLPLRAREHVLSKSLRADYHYQRRADERVAERDNSNVLATAWVYATPSANWQTLAGAHPRLADGTPQPVLATTGCIVALSTRDHLWCAGMEHEGYEDVDEMACVSIEETPGCLQPMAVLIHEMVAARLNLPTTTTLAPLPQRLPRPLSLCAGSLPEHGSSFGIQQQLCRDSRGRGARVEQRAVAPTTNRRRHARLSHNLQTALAEPGRLGRGGGRVWGGAALGGGALRQLHARP